MEEGSAKQVFYIAKNLWKTTLAWGLIITALCVYAAYVDGNYQYLIFGALIIGIALWQRNRVIVSVFEKHIEIKDSIIKGRQYLYFDQIKEIKRKSEKKVKVYVDFNGRIKSFRLPLAILDVKDRSELMKLVESKLP